MPKNKIPNKPTLAVVSVLTRHFSKIAFDLRGIEPRLENKIKSRGVQDKDEFFSLQPQNLVKVGRLTNFCIASFLVY
jgi:hypothetical protein